MTARNPLRRWSRLGLRTLFVITTILGMLLGWLGVQLKWIHDRREALRWILPIRARQLAAESGTSPPSPKGFYISQGGVEPPWSLKLFGERGVERIEVDEDWLGRDALFSLDELRSLFPEADVMEATNKSPPEERHSRSAKKSCRCSEQNCKSA